VDFRDTGQELEILVLTGSAVICRLGLNGEEGSIAGFAGERVYNDLRSPAQGARAYLPANTGEQSLLEAELKKGVLARYDAHRFSLGISDSTPEIEPETSHPMECGLDRLNGVSFSKGFYVGQEVTVRMKNRNLARKCLDFVKIGGAPPAIGTQMNLEALMPASCAASRVMWD